MIYDLLEIGCSHKTSGAGSGKEFTSNCSTSSLENGNTAGFIAARCSPSKAFHGNAMSSQTRQELELTLLPSILKSTGCNRDSGLVYADMIESGDAVGSLYQSLEHSAPLNELNSAMVQMEVRLKFLCLCLHMIINVIDIPCLFIKQLQTVILVGSY